MNASGKFMPEQQKYNRKLIFSSHDEFETIEVVEDDQYRSLHFGTPSRQSEMNLKDPFALTLNYFQTMALAFLFNTQPQDILILGLGGGSLAKFIWKYFPNSQLELVERSAQVIDICFQYFEFPKSPRLHINCADALDFIKTDEKKYDLIFADLFQAEGSSGLAFEIEFFRLCKSRLKDNNSIFVLNTWQQTPKELMIKCVRQLCESFGRHLLILPDHMGNNIFIVFSPNKDYKQEEILHNANELTKKTNLDFMKLLKGLNFLKGYGVVAQT
jgi:spermidine synthase